MRFAQLIPIEEPTIWGMFFYIKINLSVDDRYVQLSLDHHNFVCQHIIAFRK